MKKIVFIVAILACIQNWDRLTGFINPTVVADSHDQAEAGVILYATQWCGYCQKTRELFAKNNIEYTEYDVEKSAAANREFKQLGGRGVPLVVVNGKIFRGYNPRGIMKALK